MMPQILNFGNEILFTIISGIFGNVARIYNILLNLTDNTKGLTPDHFDGMLTTIYVLAGVFMLFRVVIGMIQMLINPDQVTDKNTGAGKLVVNVITCIIMLMVFVPNGLIFGDSGLLTRLENALLDREDGLVTRLAGLRDVKNSASGADKSVLAEDVYAETESLTCYYIDKNVQKRIVTASGPGTSNQYSVDMPAMYKIVFYKDSTSGSKKIVNSNYSYTDGGGQRIAGNDENGRYSSLNAQISAGDVFDKDGKLTCPKSFSKGKTYLISNKKFPSGNSFQAPGTCNEDANGDKFCDNIGIMGGWTSLDDVKKTLSRMTLPEYSVSSDVPFISSKTLTGTLHNTGETKRNTDHLRGVSPVAVVFAQSTASSLQDCTEEKEKECTEAQKEMFTTSKGDDAIIELMDSKDLKVDFIFSVVAGVGIMIYLLFLCVEVIIRKFKLYLLEVIAPIAIISHVIPKDQVFGKWYKMLISVYVDLFIKLIAIGFAIGMIEGITDNMASSTGPLVKFFYIVAVLVFAKIVPTMISKIFGLDSMGGSFKDIMGLGKTAAGFGAGAVLGGAVGAATGKGVGGRLGGLAKGALMGAGSGAKGNLKGGANAIASKNAQVNAAKANGLGFWQRTAAGISGSVGYSPKARMDNEIKDKVDKQKMLDDFRKHKDNVEEAAEKFSPIADLKQQMLQGNITKNEFKRARKEYIAAAERGDSTFSFDVIRKDSEGHDFSFYKTGEVEIKAGDRDKVVTKIDEMKTAYNSNSALQREIAAANGNKPIDINSYAAYENAEEVATKKRNQYNKDIIAVQSSDAYHRAQAFEDYSKNSK